jgi:hydrogenase maturation protein HypF
MGRLFDAAACLLGLRTESFYEGQAAMELEALAGAGQGPSLPFPIVEADGRWQMDPLPLLLALADRRRRGEAPAALAAAFHDAVAATAVELAARAAELGGSDTVVLGGGSFQNVRLLETVRDGLAARRLRPLRPLRLSPNDGAIAFGQVAVAAARLWRDLP